MSDPLSEKTLMETSGEELFLHSPCGFLALDEKGTILRANLRIARLLGTSPERMEGTWLPDWLTPGSQIYLDTHVLPLLRIQGAVQEIALDMRTLDHQTIPLLMDGQWRDPGARGGPSVLLGFADTRQRRRYERELLDARREAEQARGHAIAILESTPYPLLTVDEQGRIDLSNKEARKFLRKDAAGLHGVSLRELLRDVEPVFGLGVAGTRTTHLQETQVQVGQENIPVEVRFSPLKQGDARHQVVSIIDLRPRKALEAERMEAHARRIELRRSRDENEFKDRFINTAAHALRTPLTPILLQLHRLQRLDDPVLDERARRAVRILDRQFRRIRRTVEQLVTVAEVEAGRFEREKQPFRLSEVFDEALQRVEEPAAMKQIQIVHGPMNGQAFGDPRAVEQVLVNLLENAVKFSAEGSRVDVKAQHDDDEIRITITDYGIGIQAQDMEGLFDRFVQVHDPDDVSDLGLGLGLYLSRRTVEAFGGRIGVESRGLGHGATFWVALPVPPVPRPPEEPAREEETAREEVEGARLQ